MDFERKLNECKFFLYAYYSDLCKTEKNKSEQIKDEGHFLMGYCITIQYNFPYKRDPLLLMLNFYVCQFCTTHYTCICL